MNFELGKEYIVAVTDKGMVPIDEFDRERFYDKDNDDLDFLTDEEKIIIKNQAYQEGLDDAWECVRKIALTGDGLSIDEREKIFGSPHRTDIFKNYTVTEAIAKIKEYEEEQQNIKSCDIKKFRAGDIVILNRDACRYKKVKAGKGIIERISFDYGIEEEKAFVNFGNGLNGWYVLRHLINTGKHYPLINEILGEIQGEE